MKTIVIIIILVIVVVLYTNSNCNENFTNANPNVSYFDNNPYQILDTDKVGPLYIDGNTQLAPAYDRVNENIYADKYWEMKNLGFSDIYNYDDMKSTPETEEKPKTSTETSTETSVSKKAIKVPSKYQSEIEVDGKKFNIIGTAINQYYDQYYLIYEYIVVQDDKNPIINNNLKYLNMKYYEYALVKMKGETPVVMHKVSPREKINTNDVVYLSYGVFELGPLQIGKL